VPELPEVETIRRQLHPRLKGRLIGRAGGHPSAKFAPAAAAAGARIGHVGRRGKYLLIGLNGPGNWSGSPAPRTLVIHLGMTGVLRLRPSAEAPDPFVRAWWELGSERFELRDVRRFGRVAVIEGDDLGAVPGLAVLGPEPLGGEFTPEHLHAALRRSNRRVKTQLLAQRAVAGVGNIYADEALWQAGINPALRRLTRAQATRLHAAVRDVLATGIANGGTTFRDYRTVDGGSGSNQLSLRCYGRGGLACPRCGTTLVRRVLDGRGTTWCPTCQRR